MTKEGIVFKPNVEVGKTIAAQELLDDNDAILLCMGATWPRDLPIPGKTLAMNSKYAIMN